MPLTLRRAIIRALDRPGGRFLLSKIATRYARSRTNADVAIYFDEIWIAPCWNAYLPRFAYL